MKTIIKLAFLLVVLLLPTIAIAHNFEVDGIYYNINGNKASVTYRGTSYSSYYEYTGEVNIPASVTYNGSTYSVTSIGDDAFNGCSGLTSVNIPNSVTSIGPAAFYDCSSLTSITIPNSVSSIGSNAFGDCSGLTRVNISDLAAWCNISFGVDYANPLFYAHHLYLNGSEVTNLIIPNTVTAINSNAFYGGSGFTSVTIPNSVSSIGEFAFSGCCGLISVTIPNSVSSIRYRAFYGCSGLTSISISNSVTFIGNGAFSGCSGLTSIDVKSGNPKYDSRDYCNAIIETESNTLIAGCQNTVILNSVTSIDSYAFYNCSGLTSVNIPNSVTSIGNSAFFGCSGLTSVNIPNSVTSIGYSAFGGCYELTSVNIPNTVTYIGSRAFQDCSGLTSVNIPNSVTSIGDYAFYNCSELTNVTCLAATPPSISSSTFSNYSNVTLSVPHNCKSIYQSTEYWKRFSRIVELPFDFEINGVYYIITDNNSVAVSYKETNCYRDNVIIPNNVTYNGIIYQVTSIYSNAFNGCVDLTSVTIGNSVTSIGDYTFQGCSGLTSVTIGNSVTSIGGRAFEDCSGLSSVNIPNSVTSIGSGAFYNCSGLTSVTIGNSVTSIGSYAFYDCSGLTSVTIPNSVSSINNYAFQGCTSLSTLNFNAVSCADFSSTTSLRPFYNLNITTVNIGNSVQRIPNYFAYGLTNLTSVTIGNSVTSIGSSAFSICSGLTRVNISDLTAWYNISFSDANANPLEYAHHLYLNGNEVINLIIPNTVTTINNYAFSGGSGFTSVTIPNSVTSIGVDAFNGCSGLTRVNISDLAAWCNISFNNSYANPLFYAHHLCLNGNEVSNLIIPNTVTSIGLYAFYNCSGLTSVSIPNSVTSIGSGAFNGCSGLTRVNISDLAAWCNISFIDASSNPLFQAHHLYLNNSEVTELHIPATVTTINNYAFYSSSYLTSVTIPCSVTSIGRNAFKGCSALDILNFNAKSCADFSSTASIRPFYGLNLSTINIGDSVQRIPAYFAYGLKKLTSVTISNSITSISDYSFSECTSLTSITIPDSVTTIGQRAFYGCTGLSGTVTIPKNVTYIGNQAFNNSPSIEAVICAAETPPTWNDMAMFTTNVYNHSPLYVPIGSEHTYMADQCWGQFTTIIGRSFQNEVLATGISLNQSQLTMLAGGTSQLIATVLPDSTTNKVVTWISSNPDIATVDTTGLVTAIAPGTATITATTTDGSNLSASCAVTVTENLSDYDNYLSMEDVEAFHGDTLVIPVKMTNEASIISFQTDIFLPEGLELLQEDGEYIIDPSERMTRTHSIMSNAVASGAIRVLCYSSNYKPFTGNSGDDLFYITVKVADNAEGDYTIQLKNTLLTNTDFVDLAAPDVAANVNVKAYLLGDANNSGTVSITDVVVTAQYVLELNPQPFVFEAADANVDGNITVADVSRIAWMVLNPTLNAPLRAPALWNNGDLMSGEGITLATGETRRVSILLDNEMDYSAFQLDLNLPEGLTASNFQLTDRADSHAFDVNTLHNGNIRALCYSPALTIINSHEGALLTFDVTAVGNVNGNITVDGIELVTANCQSVKLDAFTIGVNNATSVNESITGKAIAQVEYFNLAGQRMEQPSAGVTLIVTTYTDGSRTTTKIIK